MTHNLQTDDGLNGSPLRNLTTRQRVGLGVAAVIVMLGLCWSWASSTGQGLVPLNTGKSLTVADARELNDHFKNAGLTGSRHQGNQLLVPQSQYEDYVAVLTSNATTSDNWAGEWERQNEQLTPFSSSGARETTREIARAKLITQMLRRLPDIEQADVVWDEDRQPGWRQSPKGRATVYLLPKPDRVLTLDVVRSVRLAVAGSKKNLDPADVAVMDLSRQTTYDGELPVIAGGDLLPALRSHAELYRREIQQQIPELSAVNVRVDLPHFFQFLAEHPDNAERELAAAGPELLQVSGTVTKPIDRGNIDSVRVDLEQRIAELTGIGGAAPNRNSQILLAFTTPATSTPEIPFVATDVAHFFRPYIWPVVGGAVSLLGLIYASLRLRKPQRSSSSDANSLPALQMMVTPAVGVANVRQVSEFDQLTLLAPSTLRSIYPHATPRRWAVALRGSSANLREQLAATLGPHDAADLRQQCDSLGPVTLGDIETSRQRILASAQSIENASH